MPSVPTPPEPGNPPAAAHIDAATEAQWQRVQAAREDEKTAAEATQAAWEAARRAYKQATLALVSLACAEMTVSEGLLWKDDESLLASTFLQLLDDFEERVGDAYRCSDCKTELVDENTRDGLQVWCTDCKYCE